MIKKIFLTIDKYNKYHSQEAVAKFVKLNKASTIIEFSGPFCRSCGVSDWLDDFKIDLEKKGIKSRLSNMKEKDVDSCLVTFRLKK